MRVIPDGGAAIDIGTTETNPTIGIVDYSRRVTDDFGVTTVVERGFSRTMSVRLGVAFGAVDTLQRRLADLRATPATWIADDRFASLNVRGFYKDFALDLAVPPLSYCTLTVEGLAETGAYADPGGDPAPDGQASTLQLLQPTTITDAVLVSSSVPENDYPAWSSSTSYALGARVIKTDTHRIYESVAAANVGNDPAGGSGKWLDVGPTNRWAAFDQALGSLTSAAGSITVTLAAGAGTAIALLDVTAATVRVQATGYDQTMPVTGGVIIFRDLPANTQATVTITGGGTVSVGTILVGKIVALGITEASPTAGITDYSRKVVDDFGEVTVVQRAWAKRMTAKALLRTDAVDMVAGRIATVRATPCLWIGQSGLDSLTVYGFFKDFSIEVGETTAKLSLSIEGLSEAAKLAPLSTSVAWPDITDPDGTKPQDGATVGAPVDTVVGDMLSQDVVQLLHDVDEATNGLLATYGETAAAAASREAADAAKAAAIAAATGAQSYSDAASTKATQAAGSAQLADAARAAAANFFQLTASTGPGVLNRNPNFAAWPDGQTWPTEWNGWALDAGTSIARIPGTNGNPFAARMSLPADKSVGFVQTIDKPFGAYVIEATVRADNVSGAGLFFQPTLADGSTYDGGSAEAKLSLLSKKDTSGWPGEAGGAAYNYLRTFSWYVSTPIDGNIARINLYAMAGWTGFGVPIKAKTIDFHSVRIRPANEAEIAQHDPITGLGAKASITQAQQVATDAAGNALATARNEYSAQFSGVTPSGLSNLIGQRPTYTEVNATVSDKFTAAAGPSGAIGQRILAVTAGLGGNLIGNSGLASLAGWNLNASSAGTTAGLNVAGDAWQLPNENNLGFSQVGGGSGYSDWESDPIATEADKLYQAAVYAASHRADVEVFVHRFDVAGNHYDYLSTGRIARGSGQNGGRDPRNWDRPRTNFTATGPCRLLLRKYDTNAGTDSYAWFTRMQVAGIPDLAYPAVPYMPGADLATSRFTQTALTDLKGKTQAYFGIEANVGGSGVAGIYGIATRQDGTVISDLALIAGRQGFYLVKPDGSFIKAMGIELINGVPLVRVEGKLRAGSLEVDELASYGFSSDGAATWQGSVTASALGERKQIPYTLTVPNVQPKGRFLALTAAITVTSNAGEQTQANYNGTGKTLYRHIVADWTTEFRLTDPQGNVYLAISGETKRVLATTAFDAQWQAFITRGSQDTGVVSDGDSYQQTISATPTAVAVKGNVVWVAT